MTVPSLDAALHILKLQPDVLLQVEGVEVVQGLGTVPAAKNIHQTLVHDGRVSESDVGLADECNVVKHRSRGFFFVAQHDPKHLVAVRVRVVVDLTPAVSLNTVLMDIFEDLDFVSAAVDVKPVLVPDESMVGSGFGCDWPGCALLHALILVRAPLELVPLLLSHFVLKQVVEVYASFSSVAAEEVEAVPIRDGASS